MLNLLKRINPVRGIIIIILIVGSAKLITTQIFIAENLTNSLKGKYFIAIRTNKIKRGDIVVVQLNNNKYYGNNKLLKRVVGLAGDKIEKRQDRFYINDKFIGKALKKTKKGTKLVSIILKTNKIPDNHIFITTRHEQGYDSRYQSLGFIPVDRVIARAYRIY